jgi:uncharacterized protein YcnI
MRKYLALIPLVFAIPGVASAHVIVTPNQVGVAATQVFSVSVPNEKEAPITMTSLRLLIPSGLTDVMPTAQAGWTITTKGGDTVTEIDWSAGALPAGLRNDFTFKAQAPATTGELDWKAYQTFSDGSTAAWDQVPVSGHADDDALTPYSVTKVINDLATPTPTPSPTLSAADTNRQKESLVMSAAALVLAALALAASLRRR